MKNQKLLCGLLLSVAVICSGIILGMMFQNSRIAEANAVDEKARTAIAIVNMDQGVEYNGEKVYYSEVFINSLEGDFSLVSSKNAEVGIKNGTYGGVITIPADLSKKVVTINAENPEQVILSYSINQHLPSEKYIEVYVNISDAQETLSSVLSYIYMSSIFDEIHTGQDNVSAVAQNDQKDLQATENLRMTRFMEGLEIKDIPVSTPEFEEYDSSAYLKLSSSYSNNVRKVYYSEYKNMKSAHDASCNNTQNALNAIDSEFLRWNENAKSYMYGFNESIENDKAVASATVEVLNNYRIILDDCRLELESKLGSLVGYYADLQQYKRVLEQYAAYLESNSPDGVLGLDQYIATNLPTFEKPGILNVSLPSSMIPEKLADEDLPSGWQILNIVDPPSTPDISQLSENLKNSVASYDPSLFFTEETEVRVDTLKNELGSDLLAEQDGLEKWLQKNINKLEEQASAYETFIIGMRSDVEAKYYEDSEELQAALDKFYAQKQETSADNEKQLVRISALLPYSQKDGLTNQSVVEFIIEPVDSQNVSSSSGLAFETGLSDSVIVLALGIIIGICLLGVVLICTIAWIGKLKNDGKLKAFKKKTAAEEQ